MTHGADEERVQERCIKLGEKFLLNLKFKIHDLAQNLKLNFTTYNFPHDTPCSLQIKHPFLTEGASSTYTVPYNIDKYVVLL